METLSLVPSSFDVSESSFTSASTSLGAIKDLPKLKNLTLQRLGLIESSFGSLQTAPFPVLESLDLRYNQIDVVPASIANLPSLKNLSIYGNPLAPTAEEISGLAAHWKMDESLVGETGGESNIQLLPSGSTPNFVTLDEHSALQFNNDYYIDAEVLGINEEEGKCNTVTFWMKKSNSNWYGMPFCWGDVTYNLWFNSNYFGFNTGHSDIIGVPISSLGDDWIHVAAVFPNMQSEADISELKLYINGELCDLKDGNGNTHLSRALPSQSGPCNVRLGACRSVGTTEPGNKFVGYLDDVRIYNRKLTDAEVEILAGESAKPAAAVTSLAGKAIQIDLLPDNPDAAKTIHELAEALYYNPIEMYEYIVNTIEYTPYSGAMKGPLATLQTRAGNSWDTASLLAELYDEAGISTDYVFGKIEVPIDTAAAYLGLTSFAAVPDTLSQAGLTSTILGTDDYVCEVETKGKLTHYKFDHAWLSVNMTLPGQDNDTFELDPSWKFKDYNLNSLNMLDIGELSFDGDLADTESLVGKYLSQDEGDLDHEYYALAYEFYENAIREYLASSFPETSIADVMYDGPIHQQIFTELPTSLAYTTSSGYDKYEDPPVSMIVESSEPGIFSSIPVQMEHRVKIKLKEIGEGDNGNEVITEIFSYECSLSEVCLEQITISPVIYGDKVRPTLLIGGSPAPVSTVSLSPNTPVAVEIEYLCGDKNDAPDYETGNRLRNAGDYIAISIDAGQVSEDLIIDQRRVVNAEAINEINGDEVSLDNQIGGFLHLAGLEYYYETNHGEDVIASLTNAVRFYNSPAFGFVTSKVFYPATIVGQQVVYNTDSEGNLEPVYHVLDEDYYVNGSTLDLQGMYGDLQIPYVPVSAGIDIPGGVWTLISADGDTSHDIERDRLAGYNASSMEAAVWEKLANTQSVSTVKAFQLAPGGSLTTIDETNVGSIDSLLFQGSPTARATVVEKIRDGIESYVAMSGNGYDFRVIVPNEEISLDNGTETWTGVGYLVEWSEADENNWETIGYIIHGGVGNTIGQSYGGASVGLPGTPITIADNSFWQSTVSDPINPATGSVYHDEVDFSYPNLGTQLEFSRHYRSNLSDIDLNLGLGTGWTFSYGDFIAEDSEDSLIWCTDEGDFLTFEKTGSSYKTPDSLFGTLTKNYSSYYEYSKWLTGWTYRKALTLNINTSSLDGFPVFIASNILDDDTDIGAHAKTDRSDIRFTMQIAEGSTEQVEPLVYEKTDSGYWVKIPSTASGTAGIKLYVYYGNDNAEAPTDSDEVWEGVYQNYEAVWHLESGGYGNSAASDGLPSADITNPVETTLENEGKFGKCPDIANNEYFEMDSGYFADSGTYSAWIKVPNNPTVSSGSLATIIGCEDDDGNSWGLMIDDSRRLWVYWKDFSDGQNPPVITGMGAESDGSPLVIPADVWVRVDFTWVCRVLEFTGWTTGNAELYINGTKYINTGSFPQAGTATNHLTYTEYTDLGDMFPKVIGKNFEGQIDEVRFLTTHLSSAEIQADYGCQSANAAFLSSSAYLLSASEVTNPPVPYCSGYTWTAENGSKALFDSSGRLTEKKDRYDNGICVKWSSTIVNGVKRINYVYDRKDPSRKILFGYDSDKITSVTYKLHFPTSPGALKVRRNR